MEQVYTAAELAPKLRITYGTLMRLTRTNKIPHFKVGRQVMFTKTEIDEWIKKGGTAKG